MSTGLTEDDIRRALGLDVVSAPPSPSTKQKPVIPTSRPATVLRSTTQKPNARSPKLRVILRVSKDFEGVTELFTHDSDTLSQFDAEQEAKTKAKKEKFRYFDVVSIKSIE